MIKMMKKMNDESLEMVTGGISFDVDDMSLEDRAVYDAKHEQFLKICCDHGRGRVDENTYLETRRSFNAFIEEMDRKYA